MYQPLILIVIGSIHITQSAIPGTFFWRPRLGLYLSQPTESSKTIHEPTRENIQKELVILIDGYSMGLSVLALAAGYQALTKPLPHLSPLSAYFYTNAYRWTLRHTQLLPNWLGGIGGSYPDTHKVWRRRYYYVDEFVPKWLQKMMFWVKSSEWEQEKEEFKEFTKHAEPSFGKHYTYPRRKFTDFASQQTLETVENIS